MLTLEIITKNSIGKMPNIYDVASGCHTAAIVSFHNRDVASV